MINDIRISACILFFFVTSISLAQSAQIDTIVNRTLNYLQQTPQEKSYLRTDKEIYTRGETLWFSTYLVDAVNHKPSSVSSLLYVDLIGPAGNVLSSLSIKIENGLGQGDFLLADTLAEGIYNIQAYTNYMRNFNPEFMFTKPVKLLDYSSQTQTSEFQPEVRDIDINFFPEGGDLVAGQLNYVAFMAKDEKGKGVKIKGNIIDGKGMEVTTFSDELMGLGKFQLTPTYGEKYFAVYTVNGVQFSKALPDVMREGYLLNIRQSPDKVYLTLKGSENTNLKNSFLLGHTRGSIFMVLPSTPGKNFIYAPIPSNQIPSGIAHFTFFDGNGVPRAERLVYNENQFENPEIILQKERTELGKRAKFPMKLSLTDFEGNPVDGNISLSVLSKSLYKPNRIDIENYLLLSSDLNGAIERPDFYLDTENADRLKHIDLLMMTHGWRRFKWNDVLSGNLPPINFYPETGFSVEGKVVKYLSREKGVQGKVELTFLENIAFKQEATSEVDGTFWFDDLQIEDTMTVIVQTKRMKKKEDGTEKELKRGTFIEIIEPDDVAIDSKFLNLFDDDYVLQDVVDQGMLIRNIEAEFGDEVVVLEEIKVQAQKDIREEPFYRESILYSQPDDRLVFDSLVNVQNYVNLFDLLIGKFPGVEITGTFPNQTALIRGFSSINQSNEALFLVDGIPTDRTLVAQIPPQQVEFVDVLKGPKAAIYSARGNGVIAIYKRRGPRLISEIPDPVGLVTFKVNGYYSSREFYSPNYDILEGDDLVKPDFRSTIFWSPSVEITDGKADVEFFTSDEKGEFQVFVEGISKEGKIIKNTFSFTVE